jgi:hypothetical protein
VIEPPEPTITDLARLQMENELLNLEVGHLRARLRRHDDSTESREGAGQGLTETRRRLKELETCHENTLHDMRRLLRRLNNSPAGPIFRRWKGFQVLVAKYEASPSK